MGAGGGGGDRGEEARWAWRGGGLGVGKAVAGGDVTAERLSCSPSDVAERAGRTLRAGPVDGGGGVEKRLISHTRAAFGGAPPGVL